MMTKEKWMSLLVLGAFLLVLLPADLMAADSTLPDPGRTQPFPPEAGDGDSNGAGDDKPVAAYGQFSGKIEEIRRNEEGTLTGVYVRDRDGRMAWLMVGDDTYRYGQEPEEGLEATGYYRTDIPMLLIYPPQYPVSVLLTGDQDLNVHVDLFDGDMVSADGMLKILTNEAFPVIRPDGTAFEGSPVDHRLAVFYGVSTRSIPAQTHPDRVVVLDDAPKDGDIDGDNTTVRPLTVDEQSSVRSVVVNGQKLQGPLPYHGDDNDLMIPLRMVLEALGHRVSWDPLLRQVDVDGEITLLPERGSVRVYDQQVTLASSPRLVGAVTYVPVDFLSSVMGLHSVQAVNGQLVVTQ